MNRIKWPRNLAMIALVLAAVSSQAAYQIIAKLVPGTDPQFIAATYGITYLDVAPGNEYFLFGASSQQSMENAEHAMRLNTAQIVWAEEDEELSITESTNGKGGGVPQLGKETIETLFSPGSVYAENVGLLTQIHWNYQPSIADRSIRVAILDTGLSPLQPAIWAHVVAAQTFIPRETRPWDYRPNPTRGGTHPIFDVVGHGTMVAGLIYSLAPDAELIIARVCDDYGRSNAWRITKGIAFAVLNGAELGNLSFGSTIEIPALEYVLHDASQAGLLCIAPVGNNNRNQTLFPSYYSETIAVCGVDKDDLKAPFSNYSLRTDLAAPATGVKSAWWTGNMAVWSGTSFAAPIVTGCLAEALKNRTPIAPEVIENAIDLMGDNIDAINPGYTDRLGVRVNLDMMRQAINNL